MSALVSFCSNDEALRPERSAVRNRVRERKTGVKNRNPRRRSARERETETERESKGGTEKDRERL